jgi:hypothetical protein
MHSRPTAHDYAPYYARYVGLVPAGDLLAILENQARETAGLLLGPAALERADFRYAPGKWSAKEVLGHVMDAERVFSYRALRFARADATPLASFDENVYAPAGEFGDRTLPDLVEEFLAVRTATVALLRGLPPSAWQRRGTASDAEVSVLGLAFIIAGHELHHRAILQSRYLQAAGVSA